MALTRRRSPARRESPTRLIAGGFAMVLLVGTGLLMTPLASVGGTVTAFVPALFTATSAVSVTGLAVVDTATHWSTFGQVVILALIQIGGLGVMALASLLGLIVAGRIGLRLQLVAQTETRTPTLAGGRTVVLRIISISLAVETAVAVALTLRFWLHYDNGLGRAAYLGIFHAVSAYNNAGFALFSDNLIGFSSDALILGPIALALVIGGLGLPVIVEVLRAIRRARADAGAPRRFTLHTRLTLITYAGLAVIGVVAIIATEWANPATLGPMDWWSKLVAGTFSGLSPRTAGFNAIDIGGMHTQSLLVTDVLMFIGGGSAGTAGGIKVTTFALLAFVIYSEVRGEPNVHALGRKIAPEVQRQAITVALMGVGAVMASTLALQYLTPFRLDDVLMESISAFATVGLSTGITPKLPAAAQLILVVLMFVGRIGPITLASALALRERSRRYDRPEERPIIG
ncbi:ATPase [Tsukamurella pulmonis]|uniref:Potassium uptake protein, TrkH family n=1 Tax=Tsukamurella pulmonis TaxID=47312 RepID=A0A1H1AKY0_9ACTN|nr:potassium transporter TrkG [Tsukamurella pulmonis]KXO96021.1 ATPase [Tsukamurella pulmonis]SDQ40141.1 potassium uptake protein, TrkH family [Tsukamurella pulmonis]SUP26501.1 Ktr system potassium uptake protein B [Tsukamurella pulmonis]